MQFNQPLTRFFKSDNKFKIIKFLLKHEALMSEREIASILKISHMNVNRTLRELAEMNLIHYIAAGKAHLWQVNRKSYLFQVLNQMVNALAKIPEPLTELKRRILKHLPKMVVLKAVIFGSIVKHKERADSDIDLFILVKNTHREKLLEENLEKLSQECLELFGNRLSSYILNEHQFNQKQNLEIIHQINKGIQIYPSEE